MKAKHQFLGFLAVALLVFSSVQAVAGPFKLEPGRKNVGILIMDDIFIVELIAPLDTYKHGGDKYNVFSVSPKGSIVGYYGAQVTSDYTLANAPKIDILVVASYLGSISDAKPSKKFTGGVAWLNDQHTSYGKDLIKFVKARAPKAEYVTSHCWGAFTLAAAGVLDGKQATTFKGDSNEYINLLAEMFPSVKTRPDKRWIRDGNIVTSQGGLAAFEASLALIEKMYGTEVAKGISRGMVYDDSNRRNVSKNLEAKYNKTWTTTETR